MSHRNRICSAVVLGATFLGVDLPAQAQEYIVDVINLSGVEMNELYISPTDSDVWGDDYLSGDRLILNEDRLVVSVPENTTDCYYDVQAIFSPSDANSDDTLEAIFWGVDLCHIEESSGLVFFPNDLYHPNHYTADERFIRVVNNSESILLTLQVTPAGETPNLETDNNLIANTILLPLGHYDFPLSDVILGEGTSASCPYDLSVHYLNPGVPLEGNITDEDIIIEPPFTVDLCSDDLAYIAVGDRPIEWVQVFNTTNLILDEFYISPQESPDWGLDQLNFSVNSNNDVQFPMAVLEATGAGCGLYDVHAIFSTAEANPTAIFYEDYGIELCGTDEFVLEFPNPDEFPDQYHVEVPQS